MQLCSSLSILIYMMFPSKHTSGYICTSNYSIKTNNSLIKYYSDKCLSKQLAVSLCPEGQADSDLFPNSRAWIPSCKLSCMRILQRRREAGNVPVKGMSTDKRAFWTPARERGCSLSQTVITLKVDQTPQNNWCKVLLRCQSFYRTQKLMSKICEETGWGIT